MMQSPYLKVVVYVSIAFFAKISVFFLSPPYLIDRNVLYIEYDFVIGTSIAVMNLSFVKAVKTKVPLN